MFYLVARFFKIATGPVKSDQWHEKNANFFVLPADILYVCPVLLSESPAFKRNATYFFSCRFKYCFLSCYHGRVHGTTNSNLDWGTYQNKLWESFFNPFRATGFFLYPLIASKAKGFLMFSRGIRRDQWRLLPYWMSRACIR